MIKKVKDFLKRIFSFRFTHPVINEKLSTAIDDKISARKKLAEAETQTHQETLNSYLRTYFSKAYDSPELMQVAFNLTNKKWVKLCKEVNGKSKLINLNKNAFKDRVKLTVKTFKELQTKNQKTNE